MYYALIYSLPFHQISIQITTTQYTSLWFHHCWRFHHQSTAPNVFSESASAEETAPPTFASRKRRAAGRSRRRRQLQRHPGTPEGGVDLAEGEIEDGKGEDPAGEREVETGEGKSAVGETSYDELTPCASADDVLIDEIGFPAEPRL